MRTRSLVDAAEDAILQHCADADLRPGDALPSEQDFVVRLDVSRSVVREAFSRLRALGLVENRKRRGPVLLDPPAFPGLERLVRGALLDPRRERELLEMRIMLEIGMADFVYSRRTPADLETLEIFAALEDAGPRTLADELTVSMGFHAQLYRMVRNSAVDEFLEILSAFFQIVLRHDLAPLRAVHVPSHRDLLTALRGPSAAVFRDTLREHFGEYRPLLDALPPS